MPSVAAIALETLLDPGASSSNSLQDQQKPNGHHISIDSRSKSRPNGYFISPQLYVTPEPTLIVPTTGISASSPSYVVNHKRRHFPQRIEELVVNSSDIGVNCDSGDEIKDGIDDDDGFLDPAEGMSRRSDSDGEDGTGSARRRCFTPTSRQSEFFDAPEGMSGRSSSHGEEASRRRCFTPMSSQSDFYDAPEDFISDSSLRASFEADLRSIRLNLFDEMERRKMAEETVETLQQRLQRMHQIFQETVVTRMVDEALVRVLAQAEAETAIEAKNREISRFRDRLQYYEAVNREMCQRNQDAIELARQQRQKKKAQRQKWVFGCVGLSLAVGASVAAYFYLSADSGTAEIDSAEGQPSK